ncbi:MULTISPECIES: type VI secretion system contractile sheath large subunit [unclassified Pseudomonas]|jgi:type VI secretion system protein ImpC|uniref:type VI secretion system contractile sheath large subunit n=1 Tax=unclassified Pseudomonas TaxID=196821 RepID=UPI000C87A509|nr:MULTISPECIES: type VI secretion system contractile sheath large subunit [unclassified Pseudomonas]PMU86742.1 type VI secretion system contractile sheath large subunit [Pseudomonas sp. GW704-F3]PMU88951.1 type VI secretion system contractile sheath large subunit [Pseudomonas sp. GW704-F5]PMU99054.1 type VI secretion system contractile sheath large subunit [Pseudomonas sp. MPBD4-3]PMV28501.1 type VI secretion system contractile sheath large subunit [Pseudomonas sp. GW704-F2]
MSEEKSQAASTTGQVVESVSLLDQLVEATRVKPGDEAYAVTRQGLEAFVTELLEPARQAEKVSAGLIDDMIATLDAKLCRQVDAIIHHQQFQKLESSWRSLKFLVDRTDFRENNKLEILSVSKEKLLEDFEDAPEITRSGLYKAVYTAEFGQFGGQPFGSIIGNYEFNPGPQDMKLLQSVAAISAMSHTPFIAAAGPQFFGIDSFADLPNLKDLQAVFEGPQFTKWNAFRESDDARFVGLTLPHFLLRTPYGEDTVPAKTFRYNENVGGGNQDFLWGNAAFAFASRLSDSFAQYRWCANVIGPQGGGTVGDLPIYNYEAMGETQTKIPTEVLISERREFELAEQGFIALTMRKNTDNAAFFSANSCQKPKFFGNDKEGKEAELNYKLGTQLPYIFVVSRLAHYIKVIQRENIGTWKERGDLESELNTWIRQYVADMDNPAAGVRSRRPLRQAEITVSDVEGDPGWYRVGLKVRPHFKYMGASFTLSLVGKLDKS